VKQENVVFAGLDPATHHTPQEAFSKRTMDARVKPAHDDR
jgi:hypothetical protein